MKRCKGFTIIEVVVFIIVTSILLTTIVLSLTTAVRNFPAVSRQWNALQIARQCMEWFVGQRQLNGYASLACPSTPSAAACNAPTGFTVSANISCTTWNGDAGYKTLTVTVGGAGSATLSEQWGDIQP